MAKTGFYSGSFDPVTLGHMDVIQRSARIFDKLVIGVGVHHGKKTMFSAEERIEMLKHEAAIVTAETSTPIEVITFDDLTVDAAKRAGSHTIVRGLRDTTDFNYEVQMAGMNQAVANEIDTIFLASSSEVRHIAATFVRQIASMGGDITSFVPANVAQALSKKLAG